MKHVDDYRMREHSIVRQTWKLVVLSKTSTCAYRRVNVTGFYLIRYTMFVFTFREEYLV